MARSSTVTLFVQLVKHIPERIIADAVAKHKTDYRSKGVRHADALFSLLFHQLSGSTSLRDTVLGMESCRDNGYEQHSGFQIVKRSTLACKGVSRFLCPGWFSRGQPITATLRV